MNEQEAVQVVDPPVVVQAPKPVTKPVVQAQKPKAKQNINTIRRRLNNLQELTKLTPEFLKKLSKVVTGKKVSASAVNQLVKDELAKIRTSQQTIVKSVNADLDRIKDGLVKSWRSIG